MKKVAVFGSVLALAFTLSACKSDVDKFVDEVCECKDMACMMEVSKKWEEKMKGMKEDKKEPTEAEKKSIERMKECTKNLK